jgi:hypothetical protein
MPLSSIASRCAKIHAQKPHRHGRVSPPAVTVVSSFPTTSSTIKPSEEPKCCPCSSPSSHFLPGALNLSHLSVNVRRCRGRTWQLEPPHGPAHSRGMRPTLVSILVEGIEKRRSQKPPLLHSLSTVFRRKWKSSSTSSPIDSGDPLGRIRVSPRVSSIFYHVLGPLVAPIQDLAGCAAAVGFAGAISGDQ